MNVLERHKLAAKQRKARIMTPEEILGKTLDEIIAARPATLTHDRVQSFLPKVDVCPEWQKKHDAGELPEGISGLRGMLTTTYPDIKPTPEEAQWIIDLQQFGTWRWLGSIVTYGDDNQITAMHLLTVSHEVLGTKF